MRNSKNRRAKNVGRFAGAVFEGGAGSAVAAASQDVPGKQVKEALKLQTEGQQASGKRDWSQANWDNPTAKEMKKFEKANGYPQYLGGFREEFRNDYMADGQIDYYADSRLMHKIHEKIGKRTGLKMNRVSDMRDAEIVNVWSDITQKEHGIPRPNDFRYNFKGYERENKEHPVLKDYPGAIVGGITYGIDAKQYTPGNEDMFQYNSVNTIGQSKDSKKLAAWHEIGHSLGLEGDQTLTDKDPSVMSYNDHRGKRLGKREYESIKKLHEGYGNPVEKTRSNAKNRGQLRLNDRKAP